MTFKIPSVFYSPESDGGASASSSESELDISQLEGESDATDESAAEGEGDDSGEQDSDKPPSRRARERAEDDSEDTSDEDEESEAEEDGELGDIEDEQEEEEKEGQEGEYPRVPMKLLKQKYPNFFKDFPQLRQAFFGYPQYAELFADVDSAREAASKAAEYDQLEASLVQGGDAKLLLTSLSENNPKALKKMVAGFSEAVRSVDQDVYLQLANPIIEELLYHANAHGTKIGNRNLQLAARHLANFVFANGGEIPDISKKAKSDAPTDAEITLQAEREQYAKEKFQTALGNVVESVEPDLKAVLNNKLDGLTGFERKQIVKEAKAEIDKVLLKDKSFQNSLRTLWKKSESQGYSSESLSRIKRAWLDRAKLIAPQVRNRLKNEAISSRNGDKKPQKDGQQEDRQSSIKFKVTNEKRTIPSGAGKTPVQGGQRRVLDPKKIDWRTTSDRDILDSK